ncbi:adenylosuccinate synthetase [Cordyceps fumosorosea ARSEF 2679]|uniref:Adenylosuccinate synthetase n=1 Tax=Cordyceps fumosorosea (strain ARSEF 2679) TaxID=1081104 RepID=A0A162JIT6_CORFA|nr:adenylosuccinate synthetase [Cordyceps fumosorosea ARSEF 2679]OAA69632.1 adenylosuccinate synthetase [Cordyceps fumosorosea ARSEF 2679]
MTITVILGAQWGDEGVSSSIGNQRENWLISSRGRRNSVAELPVDGVSYSFHLLPSGLMNPRCMNFIGSGVVFHMSKTDSVAPSPTFFSELKELEEKGLTAVHDRILVSDRVNVLLDMHMAVDGLEEKELGDEAIGTTKRGTVPSQLPTALFPVCWVRAFTSTPVNEAHRPMLPNKQSGKTLLGLMRASHCALTFSQRTGIKLTDIFYPGSLEKKMRRLADGYRKRFGELFTYDVEAELARFEEYRETMGKYVVDGVSFMASAQQSDSKIVIEGANALMLDVDYGSYPFVTSSNTTLAGVIGGLALNPKNITETVGVVKAYTTRVGWGAFKTEDTEEGRRPAAGADVDGELSSLLLPINLLTVGRLDLVVVKYSNSINYYTSLNLTKELDSYPADLEILERAEVVYHEMPGWQKPTTNARTWYDLPKKARDYVEYIEQFVGVKIKYVGTGPEREAMIQRA